MSPPSAAYRRRLPARSRCRLLRPTAHHHHRRLLQPAVPPPVTAATRPNLRCPARPPPSSAWPALTSSAAAGGCHLARTRPNPDAARHRSARLGSASSTPPAPAAPTLLLRPAPPRLHYPGCPPRCHPDAAAPVARLDAAGPCCHPRHIFGVRLSPKNDLSFCVVFFENHRCLCNDPCYQYTLISVMRTSILRLQSFFPLRYLALSHDHKHNN
jgi:hypothetical protein